MKPGTARIQFDVDEEIKHRLDKQLSWGDLKAVYNAITLDLVNLLEHNDTRMVVGAIVSNEVSLKDYIKSREDGDSTRPEKIINGNKPQ